MCDSYKVVRVNNENNKKISIAPLGRNFRGAGPGSVLISRGKREEECL